SRQLSASWFVRRVFFDNILERCRYAAVVGNLLLLRLIAAIMFQASCWPQHPVARDSLQKEKKKKRQFFFAIWPLLQFLLTVNCWAASGIIGH
ncbi:MAG: hypothetical protein ACK2UN_16310, partial [Candidatus Promineifilaceae bacterium]